MHLLLQLRVAEINVDRLRRGEGVLTDDELADAADLNVRTVRSLLSGDVDRIDLNSFNKLITALRRDRPELNVGDLLEYRPDPAEVPA